MNMLKNIMTASLFIGIGGWYAVNAQKPDTQLKKIEARIDAKLKKMGLLTTCRKRCIAPFPALKTAVLQSTPTQSSTIA